MEYQGSETMKKLLFLLLCVLFPQQASAQLPPAFGNVPQSATTSSSNCNYLLSAGTAGSCVVTTVDVERKLTLLNDGISRQGLQYVAQNSYVQSQIADLQKRDKQFSLQMDGIRRDLLALSSRTLQSSSTGGGNININQLQSSLTQAINNVDNRLNNLSRAHQRDAVSQSKVNSILQAQYNKLENENQQLTAVTSSLSLQLQQLVTQLRSLAAASAAGNTPPPATAATPAPTTATSNPAVSQNIQALIATVNQNSAAITRLTNQQAIVSNNTKAIGDLKAELALATINLRNTSATTNSLDIWKQNFVKGDLKTMKTDISTLKGALTTVNNTLSTQVQLLTNQLTPFIIGQQRQDNAIVLLAGGVRQYLGNNVQIRQQLVSLEQQIKKTIQPVVAPPLLTTQLPIVAPPLPGK